MGLFDLVGRHIVAHGPEEDEKMSVALEQEWKSLYLLALSRSHSLEPTKERFASMTRDQISDFLKLIEEFVKRFYEEGPGAVGQDLEQGAKLMEDMEEKRSDLVNAEMLFDIPLADYSPFLKAAADMSHLEAIYTIYRAQKVSRELWAKTLWVNLNPQTLLDGMENFQKEFRRLPRDARQMPVGQVLELFMKQFRNSVPLFVALKNEALRPRHWQELMDKTGQEFDMSAEVFTLENMFAMELHRYQEIAEQIINNAIKELSIEKGVKEIADTWTSMLFSIHKHIKGTDDRGYILGAVDEIMQALEDNSMNLQSMAGSQYGHSARFWGCADITPGHRVLLLKGKHRTQGTRVHIHAGPPKHFHNHSLSFHNYPRPPTATPCCRDCSPASHRDSVLPGQFLYLPPRLTLPEQFLTSHRDSRSQDSSLSSHRDFVLPGLCPITHQP
uniref:Dynein heavy chain linker domain-containing protein n=1 Tax=Timema monikensis TaxID=170555 RepID=A0A7R9EA84_9NEOP|nr:unnamed protein product [Timema monikensis]